MDRIYPIVPELKECVLAFSTNDKKQTEHILIGELQEIRAALNGSNTARILSETKRPIGSLIADCCHSIPGVMSDIRVALSTEESSQNLEFWNNSINALNQLYNSNNESFKFFALRVWQEYKIRTKNSRRNTDDMSFFINFIEDLTLPVRLSLESIIQKGQSGLSDSPLDYFDNTLLNGSAKLFYNNENGVQEYIVADTDLMPVVIYSLKHIYSTHQYFQRCKVCNKLFLAHTANIPTLCSDKCRRTQSRLNKRKYDKAKKNISYEKDYKNSYMYWYNKLEKLKKAKVVNYEPFEKAFQSFCMDARVKKRAVKDGSLSVSSFNSWMLAQRTKADEIMSQLLAGQSHIEK
ncbi:hypothetical protein CAFE_34980 [Caprobacter fermentans]|uniref:Uncharacterized protein n=1 Tax=Caproicibacter fermentans TaxID=2576756 RepID=A0A6N8I3V4_9FIRM|nr:hypothetical protein [Caproicibacter fermentans]MVB12754.1 hypothetical protein [Caproicibacter fermentans]